MKKATLALAIAAATAFSAPALAQDYQMEAGLSYANINPDDSTSDNDSAIGVDFTYHFDKVSTQNRPLAEAAFLGHNSNVSASYADTDKADFSVIGLGAEVWMEQFYLSVNAAQTDYGDAIVDDQTNYGVRAGFMVQDGLLAYVGADNGDGYDKAMLHVGAKYVGKLGSNFVNLEGDIANGDEDAMGDAYTILSLTGDYFFTNKFSAGLRYTKSNAEFDDEAVMGVGARFFVTPLISGGVEYSTQKDEADIISLRVAARF